MCVWGGGGGGEEWGGGGEGGKWRVNVTRSWLPSLSVYLSLFSPVYPGTQELCESRGGRPGLPSPIILTVSVDVKHCRT